MIIILTIVLFILFRKQYKENGWSPSSLICFSFLISSIGSVLFNIFYPEEVKDSITLFTIVYYTICQYIFLYPFSKFHGAVEEFVFPKKIVKLTAFILFIGALCLMYESIKEFDVNTMFVNFLDRRKEYYEEYTDAKIATSLTGSISGNLRHLLFLSLPLSFFCFSKDNKFLGYILLFSSFAPLVFSITIAERQGFLIWLGNLAFSSVMFKNSLSKRMKKYIVIFSVVISFLTLTLILAITFSRFGDDDVLLSLFDYGGVQPFNASQMLTKLSNQILWGKLNFPFLHGGVNILILNDYFNTDIYLNSFGSIVGSFYLDFGYYTIIFAGLYSFVFYKLISHYSKKKSFLGFFFYSLYFQIMFVGIFYYKYNSVQAVRIILLYTLMIILIESIFNRTTVKSNK